MGKINKWTHINNVIQTSLKKKLVNVDQEHEMKRDNVFKRGRSHQCTKDTTLSKRLESTIIVTSEYFYDNHNGT